MKKLLPALVIAALSLAAWSAPANAQGTATSLCIWSINSISGQLACVPVDGTNPLPVSASASISGWPGSTQTTGTPISVTTSGVTGTLPSGAVVLATNVGTTNTAFCKLGASATTSDTPIFPNSSVSFTVGANTQLTCITSTSTTTVNMSGGAGLPTGWGGGGSGGSGSNASVGATGAAVPASATYVGITSAGNLTGWNGAVTQSGSWTVTANDSIADGADVAQGAKADSACGSDAGTCTLIALVKRLNGTASTTATNTGAAVPAGTNRIGYTSDDPCAQGTKTQVPISQTASTKIISGTSAKKTYVCSLVLIAGAAEIVNVIEGTGSTCGTGTTVLAGSSTAANGLSFAANGGLTIGGFGSALVAGAAAADDVCLTQSGSNRVSGWATYVQQ